MDHKKLFRSKTNRVFAGIFGGLGEYFSLDATILRLIAILIFVFTGFIPGVIAYLLALLVIPEEPITTTPPPQQS